MAKKRSPEPDPRAKDWFAAASRQNRAQLGALLDDGFDVDYRDQRGRTALFYAIAPYGGNPELVKWLVGKGADVNLRDPAGETALDFGWGGVTAALEANMMTWTGDLFRQHGYVGTPKSAAIAPRKVAKRKLSDFWGSWVIDGGDDDGQQLRISSRRIDTDVRSLRLVVDEAVLDERGRLKIHGDHATEVVHVTIVITGAGAATLRWSDGIMGPLPDIRLKRR